MEKDKRRSLRSTGRASQVDSSGSDLSEIRELATKFREAIERCPRERLPITFADFPRGACGDATLLLAKHFERNGHTSFFYVLSMRKRGVPRIVETRRLDRRYHRRSIRRSVPISHRRYIVELAYLVRSSSGRSATGRLRRVRQGHRCDARKRLRGDGGPDFASGITQRCIILTDRRVAI